eukprot:7248594-Ditylum_brightwellii.AAC.1
MERRFRRAIGRSCSKKKATTGGTSEDFIPPLTPTKQMSQSASADLSNSVKIGTTIVRNSLLRAWPAR